jgi:hypothetical protein
MDDARRCYRRQDPQRAAAVIVSGSAATRDCDGTGRAGSSRPSRAASAWRARISARSSAADGPCSIGANMRSSALLLGVRLKGLERFDDMIGCLDGVAVERRMHGHRRQDRPKSIVLAAQGESCRASKYIFAGPGGAKISSSGPGLGLIYEFGRVAKIVRGRPDDSCKPNPSRPSNSRWMFRFAALIAASLSTVMIVAFIPQHSRHDAWNDFITMDSLVDKQIALRSSDFLRNGVRFGPCLSVRDWGRVAR